ncbi:MAG TPA: NUDIX hydrolase [Acidobacteriota bacterium]|nr:NUDIX hydrolase [Acidobacteriota bacterium]
MRPHNCYLTADVIVHVGNEVLLVRRKNEPFRGMWCIPGGFVDPDEKILDAALRELKEETNVDNVNVIPFGTYGDPGRDPRGRTVTVVYATRLNEKPEARAGDDAAESGWFSLSDLPPMAFDHKKVLQDYQRCVNEGKIGNVCT